MTETGAQLYARLVSDSHWVEADEAQFGESFIPSAWRPWLLHRDSLTTALIEYSQNNFRVQVLSEQWATPENREAQRLNCPAGEKAMIREVELLCNEQVTVYARSIIPASLFNSEPDTFVGLGSKPLGHLLFKDGRARFSLRAISTYTR